MKTPPRSSRRCRPPTTSKSPVHYHRRQLVDYDFARRDNTGATAPARGAERPVVIWERDTTNAMWKFAAACIVAALVATPAAAQQATSSVLAIDSTAAVDVTVDDNGNHVTGIFIDSLASVEIARGLQAVVRPQVQRLGATGEWNRQIWVADIRYERPGPVAVRVEGGYIPSPIGLANLTLRPQLNPTIAQPAALFTSIPALEPRGPRINLLTGMYPLGAQATVSALHWDTRVAVIDTSPLRLRRVFASLPRPNPPRFT